MLINFPPPHISSLWSQQVQFPFNTCNSDSQMLPEDGAQGAFGAEAFVKIHLVHHKTFFSAGPGQRGTACCASQGTETQALLPKQQTPSRSRPRENFTQTLPRDLRYSWGKARHFLLSSCSLRAHLQEVSQFPSRRGGQRPCPAGSEPLAAGQTSA